MAENTPNPPLSTDRADCPKEACLEFIVVDHWGNEISPPTAYKLEDVGPVNPGVLVTCLKKRNYTLRATDGEELREKMKKKLPYEPQGKRSSPQSEWATNTLLTFLTHSLATEETASQRAKREKREYHKAEGEVLWTSGVPLLAGKTPDRGCQKHLVELDPPSLDYAIIMAFLDNHSGGYHGSGHAGILIINGSAGNGTYTDFGQYREVPKIDPKTGKEIIDPKTGKKIIEELAKVRIGPFADGLIQPGNNKLDEVSLGEIFVTLNDERGSKIISAKSCIRIGLEGPSHPNMGGEAGFAINGTVAWAAFALYAGAYDRMLAYANKQEKIMAALKPEDPNGYKLAKFNCMTYSIAVLDVGLGLPEDMTHGKRVNADHPNDHIGKYMRGAVEAGFFDHRMALGEPEAHKIGDSGGTEVPGIRHHKNISCVSYTDQKALEVP